MYWRLLMCTCADSSMKTLPFSNFNLKLPLFADQDGAEPSANSVSCMNLLRLAEFFDSAPYRDKAVRMLTTFSDRLNKIPVAAPEIVCALMFLLSTPKQVGYVFYLELYIYQGIFLRETVARTILY